MCNFVHFRFNPSSRNIKIRTRYTCVSPKNGGSPGDVVQNLYRHEGKRGVSSSPRLQDIKHFPYFTKGWSLKSERGK